MELRFYKGTFSGVKVDGVERPREFIDVVNYGKRRQCREGGRCNFGGNVYDSASVLLPWDGSMPPTYGVVHREYVEGHATEIAADDVRALPNGGMLLESVTELLAHHAERE